MDKSIFEKAGKLIAWNYAISMTNSAEFVRTGYHLFKLLLVKRTENLQQVLQGSAPKQVEDYASFPPGDTITLGDEKYSIHLLLEMCAQNIIQNARSFFDYCAQSINCVFLDEPLPDNKVSFHAVKEKCNNPDVKAWMQHIEENRIYSFVCDYNNSTKHSHMIDLKIWFSTEDLTTSAKTSRFRKQLKESEHSYEQFDVIELVETIYDLLYNTFHQADLFITEELKRGKIHGC